MNIKVKLFKIFIKYIETSKTNPKVKMDIIKYEPINIKNLYLFLLLIMKYQYSYKILQY